MMKHFSENLILKVSLIIIVTLTSYNIIDAQCYNSPSSGACSGGDGTLYDGANVNSGNYYWWNGGTLNINNLNLAGGTIVICSGSVTINNMNYNAGNIIIMGGTVTINNNVGVNGSNSSIVVQSNAVLNSNGLNLQGNPAVLYNYGTVNNNGNISVNNNSQIVNYNTINTGGLTLQTSTSPSICQYDGAIINVNGNFYNNTTNSIYHNGSGNSCIYLGSNITLNNNLSSTSSLYVCDAPGGTQNGNGTFGNATYFNNCSSCYSALPIELMYFNYKKENDAVKLYWSTAVEINNHYFTLEKSYDGINFYKLAIIKGAGNSYTKQYYKYIDEKPYDGITYYQLSQTDFDGTAKKLGIVSVMNEIIYQDIQIMPNPASDKAVIIIPSNNQEDVTICLTDITGKTIEEKNVTLYSSNNYFELPVSSLDNGLYFVSVIGRCSGRTLKLVKDK